MFYVGFTCHLVTFSIEKSYLRSLFNNAVYLETIGKIASGLEFDSFKDMCGTVNIGANIRMQIVDIVDYIRLSVRNVSEIVIREEYCSGFCLDCTKASSIGVELKSMEEKFDLFCKHLLRLVN